MSDESLLTTTLARLGVIAAETGDVTAKFVGQVKAELLEAVREAKTEMTSKPVTVDEAQDDSDSDSESDSSSASSDSSSSEEMEEIKRILASTPFTVEGRLASPPPPSRHSPEEWARLVRKYAKRPTNALESDREQYFQERYQGKLKHLDDCRTEADLMVLQRQRYVLLLRSCVSLGSLRVCSMEGEVLSRARLSIKYEEKESARRALEWKQRKLWGSPTGDFKLPAPEVDIV